MSKTGPIISNEYILEQVLSNGEYYNNIQNVKEPQINAILSSSDDQLLAEIGYKAELRRQFSTLQVFGVSFSIMSLLPSIASILVDGLTAGPAGAIWGWFISSMFIFFIGISMSENASSQPTSGGLYYWTNYYAPPKWKTVLSYVIGNTNSIALIGALCSVDYGFAQEVLSIVVIHTDGQFNVTPAKLYGVFVACVFAHILITCASSHQNSRLQVVSIFMNLFLICLYVIALPIGARKNFQSANYVFTHFDNFSDWPIGWTQMSSSWLSAIWTIGAFDSCVHMSEEARNPISSVPIGILGSIGACWILGFIILIVTMFCIQTDDISGHIIGSKFGQPMAQVIYDALGKKWAMAFMSLIAVAQFVMGASILTAISRQIWAFARDNGLPFSFWIKKVNSRLSTPINAVWFGGIVAILLGLLCLIGSTAANALFTLYIAGNYFAWGMPTFLRLTCGKHKFIPGPFYLGNFWSQAIGWTSTLFIAYTIIMVMLPSTRNPTKETMNYTCVITPGVWIISLVYYYIYAKKIFHGPIRTTEEEEGYGVEVIENALVAESKN